MKPTDVFGVGKPATKKYSRAIGGCISPELIIGVELETENVNLSGTNAGAIAKPYNLFVETDGSLRGVAYEFISYPMRTDQCLAALTDFFAATKFGPANYTDRTSVHVHVNCTDMEMEQISALALLYTVFEEIIFEYVGANRDSNIFCIPWNQCRQHLDLINKFLGDSGSVLKRWNKYTALNLIPLSRQGTVEFRQMHGTSDMAKLGVWINLIGSLFKWAKTYELKVLISELKELNSNSQYEAFFNKIVSGLLPYNEIYREKLEQGVIFAKYSLVSMEVKRTKPSAKIAEGALGNFIVPPPPQPRNGLLQNDIWPDGIGNINIQDNQGLARIQRQLADAAILGAANPYQRNPAPNPNPIRTGAAARAQARQPLGQVEGRIGLFEGAEQRDINNEALNRAAGAI